MAASELTAARTLEELLRVDFSDTRSFFDERGNLKAPYQIGAGRRSASNVVPPKPATSSVATRENRPMFEMRHNLKETENSSHERFPE